MTSMIKNLSLARRLLSGEEITVNISKETAFIGKYTNHGTQVPYEWIKVLVNCGFIECDSGNLENGDQHYVLNLTDSDHLKNPERN